MLVFVVIVSLMGECIEPWGVYSTEERAMIEQLKCRQVYNGSLTGKIGIYESCEIWHYKIDSDEHRWYPRPEVPQPPTELDED